LPSNTSFDPYTLSIPLLPGAGCSTYASIWLDVVERVREAFEPDYIVVQCGVDGLSGDGKVKIGNWSLGGRERDVGRGESNDEHKCEESELELETGSLGWCISRIVNQWPGKKLFLGGGGYNHPNAARAWAFLTSIIVSHPSHCLLHVLYFSSFVSNNTLSYRPATHYRYPHQSHIPSSTNLMNLFGSSQLLHLRLRWTSHLGICVI